MRSWSRIIVHGARECAHDYVYYYLAIRSSLSQHKQMKEQKATAQRKRTDASSLYRKQQEHRAKLRNFQVDTLVMVLPLVRHKQLNNDVLKLQVPNYTPRKIYPLPCLTHKKAAVAEARWDKCCELPFEMPFHDGRYDRSLDVTRVSAVQAGKYLILESASSLLMFHWRTHDG
jgi:hypothetical protein